LRIRAACDAASADSEATRLKLQHYVASRSMLERRLGQSPLLQQLSFELETLRALPPAGAPVAA
jgi:hypothetical protein